MPTLKSLIAAYGHRVVSQVDDVARMQTADMRDDIVQGWPVGDRDGSRDEIAHSRDAWEGPIKVGHAHYRLTNPYVYAPVIEYGGYPGVGPKTERVGAQVLPGGIAVNGGIYPSQRPAAPVRQAMSRRVLPLNQSLANVMRDS